MLLPLVAMIMSVKCKKKGVEYSNTCTISSLCVLSIRALYLQIAHLLVRDFSVTERNSATCSESFENFIYYRCNDLRLLSHLDLTLIVLSPRRPLHLSQTQWFEIPFSSKL